MESVSLPTWEAFTAELQKIRDNLTRNSSGKPPDLLFRGQSDSSWRLTTTLERADCEGMSFGDYYRLTIQRVRPTVEALTGATWDVPDFDVSMEQAFLTDRELFFPGGFPSPSFYRYMVYLRHHGFPSPLLDWTSSVNVAAFFAFREIGKAEPRSIYVYCESPHGTKGGAVGEPSMRVIGRYVRTHARHFRQQSDYTICAEFGELAGWHFYPHDEVFWSRGRQDYVWKFDLPSTERLAILESLDEYNLNAFSLFDSQETLLETMWLREQVLKSGALPMIPPSETELPFSGRKLAEMLKARGYDTHPQGMVQPFGNDYEKSSDGQTVLLDVNADAVRKNGETPDRPIRLTFEYAGVRGSKHVWRLKSVAELAPGVASRALDRLPEMPKRNAPWPR